eukprot:1154968-Pelagomonas_calceolata.AAC.2
MVEDCAKNSSAEITLHIILLGVGGPSYTAHTPYYFRKIEDPQKCTTLAPKLHAHSVQYAHKLTSTRRAIEKECTHQNPVALESRAARDSPDPHQLPSY